MRDKRTETPVVRENEDKMRQRKTKAVKTVMEKSKEETEKRVERRKRIPSG